MEKLKLPELPECPEHKNTPPRAIADCYICWKRFAFQYEFQPIIDRLNRIVGEYQDMVDFKTLEFTLIGNGWVLQSSNILPLAGKEYQVYTKTRGIRRAWVNTAYGPLHWFDLNGNEVENALAWKVV